MDGGEAQESEREEKDGGRRQAGKIRGSPDKSSNPAGHTHKVPPPLRAAGSLPQGMPPIIRGRPELRPQLATISMRSVVLPSLPFI